MLGTGIPATIPLDTPCIKCGYNLRGLNRESVCPECGGAIADSYKPELFLFADRRWLVSLHRGALVAMIGVLLMPLLPILALAPLLAARSVGDREFLLVPLAFVGASVVAAVGWWMLSRRDPTGQRTDETIRVYARGGGLAFVACTALLLVFILRSVLIRSGDMEGVRALVLMGLWFCWIVWCLARAILMNVLFGYVPDDLGAGLSMALLLAGVLLNTVGLVFGLGPLIVVLLELVLLNRLRRQIKVVLRGGASDGSSPVGMGPARDRAA